MQTGIQSQRKTSSSASGQSSQSGRSKTPCLALVTSTSWRPRTRTIRMVVRVALSLRRVRLPSRPADSVTLLAGTMEEATSCTTKGLSLTFIPLPVLLPLLSPPAHDHCTFYRVCVDTRPLVLSRPSSLSSRSIPCFTLLSHHALVFQLSGSHPRAQFIHSSSILATNEAKQEAGMEKKDK